MRLSEFGICNRNVCMHLLEQHQLSVNCVAMTTSLSVLGLQQLLMRQYSEASLADSLEDLQQVMLSKLPATAAVHVYVLLGSVRLLQGPHFATRHALPTSSGLSPALLRNTIFRATVLPVKSSLASCTSENPPCRCIQYKQMAWLGRIQGHVQTSSRGGWRYRCRHMLC